jgi:ribosomal protein S18 acetylase RimI-like enzyme
MTEFRKASLADTDLLLSMMREFYAEEGYPFEPKRARGALVPLLEDDSKGRVFILHDGGVAAAYVVLALGWSLEYRGRDAFVDELYVIPTHRRRGLGTRALELVDEACREIGVQALHLEVERDNQRARELYRSRGFVDHDRILMTRKFEI